jgi:pyridoxal biosynthesis lyase PdxS
VSAAVQGSTRVKRGTAEMLRGGVIMDVVTPEQAKIANDIDEWAFTVPFVCGATNLGEALRRIAVDDLPVGHRLAGRGW